MRRTNAYKVFGSIIAIIGLIVSISAMPYWVWTSFLGLGLIFLGWLLYRVN